MIIHCTVVHARTDTRIRIKEVRTLASELPRQVALFVLDGQGCEIDGVGGFDIVDIGKPFSARALRMTIGVWRMYRAVKARRPIIVHFHDPELIPMGLCLRLSRIKVIYDVHENVPQQLRGKYWIPKVLRRPLSWIVGRLEWWAGKVLSAFVAATPSIARRFPEDKTCTVQNFPITGELIEPVSRPYHQRPPHFAFIGGISAVRGIFEMIAGIEQVSSPLARLQMAGGFQPEELLSRAKQRPGWARVDYHGWAARTKVAQILGSVRAGLVLFHPMPNHVDSQPNKLFEYMAAGLPVIASDFPLWRELIDGVGCGLLVNPNDSLAITGALEWILDHPNEAAVMGERGRAAVEQRLNWDVEARKLVTLYRLLLESTDRAVPQ
jgi:glycosyltransferase involved in cell wall biosynthesis